MKLHLGCGQKYFEGYINIDYPLTEHSVQEISVADEHANLMELNYKPGSISEVRLHHVFEHFTRPCALALLASWNSWLIENGILCIEVPDFEKSVKKYLSLFTSEREKYVALRHIFGSQEAHWAVHFDGYSRKLFKELMPLFGFQITEVSFNNWRGTYNIMVKAKKIENIEKPEAIERARVHLGKYLVSEDETNLLNTWIEDFTDQLNKTYSKR